APLSSGCCSSPSATLGSVACSATSSTSPAVASRRPLPLRTRSALVRAADPSVAARRMYTRPADLAARACPAGDPRAASPPSLPPPGYDAGMKPFDYVIVGAGSAGCVLAARLSEDPKNSVLLLEAGGEDSYWLLHMPLAFPKVCVLPAFNWGYSGEPEPHADNRRIPMPRGKVLGGSSTINGLMYARGDRSDYDGWRQLGLSGWSYAEILPYFRRAEANFRGESVYHGVSGPMTVSRHVTDTTIYPRIMETARRRGFHTLDDFHGATCEGYSTPDFNVHKGRRASTAAQYLRPALQRPNLTVETHAMTTRVLMEHGRAIGVEYEQSGRLRQVHATREVILCGGAYNSPQLLMLSGIGPAAELEQAGVRPLHDLPGVGRNLQDHPSVRIEFIAND